MPEAHEVQAWADVLGDLEARLAGVAGHDMDPTARTAWHPPRTRGPIPAELVDRARSLLAAQERVADELRAALADTARHLAAVKSIPSRIPRGTSVYLDVVG